MLGMVVVDYCGYCVMVQFIIFGILEWDQEQSVIYGFIDFGKIVVLYLWYLELLECMSWFFKILWYWVFNDCDEEVEFCFLVECKGIIGNDGCYYIFDLLCIFFLDFNFLLVFGEELFEECVCVGFLCVYWYKFCCLCQELVDVFVEYRYFFFMKLVVLQLMQQKISQLEIFFFLENGGFFFLEFKFEDFLGLEVGSEEEGSSVSGLVKVKELVEIIVVDDGIVDFWSWEVICNVCKVVGFISSIVFDICFNFDIFLLGVCFFEFCQDEVWDQKQLLKDVVVFLLFCQIFGLVKDCVEYVVLLMDGVMLVEVMCQCGINMCYLGKVLELVLWSLVCYQLDYVYKIGIGEFIICLVKYIFKIYLQGVEFFGFLVVISYFLNCFLSFYFNFVVYLFVDELVFKKRNKRRKNWFFGVVDNIVWVVVILQEFWKDICQEVKNYFGFYFECEIVDQVVEIYGLQKIIFLWEILLKIGIQVLLKEYSFDSCYKFVFIEEDVFNIFFVVKYVNFKVLDVFYFFQSGQVKVQQGFLKEGCEFINEVLNLFNNVYGVMYVEICVCLCFFVCFYYIMGDYVEVLSNQQKVVLMSEWVMGIEYFNIIQEYMYLVLYCFVSSQLFMVLSLLYCVCYFMLLVFGEDYFEMVLLDNNIGLVLYGVMEYDLLLCFLENVLVVSIKYYGFKVFKVVFSYYFVVCVYESKVEFWLVLQYEKEGYIIYKMQLGEDYEKIKESFEYFKCLIQQVVVLQCIMNEIYCNGFSVNILLFKFIVFSMVSVLEQLNVINGILFIFFS